MTKRVIIYRDELLPYSETFIPAQVENYSSYAGFYVGTSCCRGAQYPLSVEKMAILSNFAKLTPNRNIFFKLTEGLGYSGWFNHLKSLSACLIHAHFGLDGVWALPIARKLKIPLIVTFHGYDIAINGVGKHDLSNFYGPTPLPQVYLWRRHRLFKKAHCCIAVSEFIRSKLIEKGCPPNKIVVHCIGVDIDKFSPDASISTEPIVLFIGRLVEKKGCEYLIQAMAKVQSILPELELVIIGDGYLRAALEQQAANSLQNYRFLGVQSSDTVRQWMNRSLLLCAPSVTDIKGDSEGLPITILEAQAMELPVISSVHAGIPEAILHGKTGFLAQEKDWEMLAEYILTLANNSQLRSEFAIAGRQRMEQTFNLKSNTAKLEAIYDRILENRILKG
ncbi:MAG: glycosyltransferase [Cyanothece sp. SIO1E1]|nr:glycosyltransferase [Cyanothece sp. SIO1E1]